MYWPPYEVCEAAVGLPRESSSLAEARQKGELATIKRALKECRNNRTQVARKLGIARSALYKKLIKYNLLEYHED